MTVNDLAKVIADVATARNQDACDQVREAHYNAGTNSVTVIFKNGSETTVEAEKRYSKLWGQLMRTPDEELNGLPELVREAIRAERGNTQPARDGIWDHLMRVPDEELAALPEKIREAILFEKNSRRI